ncbi:cytosolic Fe-S cluster assembly factor NUBP2 homolog 2 [Sipha flava]|uniref:Cytosolic Fe-S cluster assembly factor NUBP2 homolog n=1 Tax=Sipha flava TaxID=143950 RepID=A0A2S2R2V3_9HEMI|nr:cytosolic Fe-S cluster assembly factor NUBP2 homolog 2 [Sipha flava]
MLPNVKHVILVMSGKGGVGKSTVSTQLALGLVTKGFRVGILDVDLCGPSVPYLLKLENQEVHQCAAGWVPVYTDESKSLGVLSIGFLTKSRNDSIVWRGPKKTAFIKQLLSDVFWEHVDYLIIDTPPGTSDEHITVMENIKETSCDGAILVTTPQQIALDDVRKELSFCRKTNIPILGIIENMSGYVCPNCTECTNLFSSNGGKSLAEYFQIPLLGTIPIDPRISSETSKYVGSIHPESPVAISFNSILGQIINPN